MQKMWVRSLDQEDPLEQEMATYSSILAWEAHVLRSLVGYSLSSVAQSCPTLCRVHGLQYTRLHCPSPTPTACSNSCHWVGGEIQPSHPLSSPTSSAFSLSQHQGLFKWVNSSHQVAKVLSFSFSISFSNEYSGLISFRIDSLDLLAVQGTLKSLLQHHSSKV